MMMAERKNNFVKPRFGKHFLCEEFACPCCGTCLMDRDFMIALNQLRLIAGRPIKINSGYRCAKHNKAVGGASHSQHLVGRAADIVIAGLTLNEMVELAERIDVFCNGGIGVYPQAGFIHVDSRGYRARWKK